MGAVSGLGLPLLLPLILFSGALLVKGVTLDEIIADGLAGCTLGTVNSFGAPAIICDGPVAINLNCLNCSLSSSLTAESVSSTGLTRVWLSGNQLSGDLGPLSTLTRLWTP